MAHELLLNASNTTEGAEKVPPYCKYTLFVIYVVVCGLITIFGTLGNILSFVVLHQEKEKRPATFLLQCLAVADTLFMLTFEEFKITLPLDYFFGYRALIVYNLLYVFPLVNTARLATIYMTVCHLLLSYHLSHNKYTMATSAKHLIDSAATRDIAVPPSQEL